MQLKIWLVKLTPEEETASASLLVKFLIRIYLRFLISEREKSVTIDSCSSFDIISLKNISFVSYVNL